MVTPLRPIEQVCLRRAYTDHYGAMRVAVVRHWQRFGGDLDEWQSLANFHLCHFLNRYDPSKSTKLSTYIYNYTRFYLLNELRKDRLRYRHENQYKEEYEYNHSGGMKPPGTVTELREELSMDAEKLVELSLKSDYFKDNDGRSLKDCIVKFMKKQGWSIERIRTALHELQIALNESE